MKVLIFRTHSVKSGGRLRAGETTIHKYMVYRQFFIQLRQADCCLTAMKPTYFRIVKRNKNQGKVSSHKQSDLAHCLIDHVQSDRAQ